MYKISKGCMILYIKLGLLGHFAFHCNIRQEVVYSTVYIFNHVTNYMHTNLSVTYGQNTNHGLFIYLWHNIFNAEGTKVSRHSIFRCLSLSLGENVELQDGRLM